MRQARITQQKTLDKGFHYDIIENTIDYGNGVIRIHKDIYRHPAVSIFPITNDWDIYLIHQFRYLHNDILTEGIAGIIDDGETPVQAAKRELLEETGMRAEALSEIRALDLAGSFIKATQYFILARGLSFGTAQPEETENIELVKMSLDEAVKKVLDGEINTASSAFGILLLDQMRKRGDL